MYRFNPVSGEIKYITKIGDIDVIGGASCYDPINQILWLTYAINTTTTVNSHNKRGVHYPHNDIFIDLFGFNVNTGKLVYQIQNTNNLETMNFDPVTGLIYGIGLQVFNETSYQRVLMTLNSKTGKLQIVKSIPGYFIINGSLAALNVKQRILYTVLQPMTTEEDTPFELVAVDINKGTLLTHPQIDSKDSSQTPWSLQYV